MTIALAIKAADGILVAADKRETGMNRAQRKSDSALKIHAIGRNCAIAIAGDGGIGTTVLQRFESSKSWSDPDQWNDCREVADALSGLMRQTEEASDCVFLVSGYTKSAGAKAQCIKKLEKMPCNYFPLDCPSSALGSIGRDWLLYYYQGMLGVDFPQLPLQRVLPIALFILSETSGVSLDVGPTFDVYELREDSCTLLDDVTLAHAAARKLQEENRRLLRSSLLPPADSTR